ncbi:MAG: response regulator [Acidimicrobiales bacterium]
MAMGRRGDPDRIGDDEAEGEHAPLVLIVEDNDKNLKLARDLLQVKGFRTLEATDAGLGIALATEHLPDLVLMDIQLADMDGWEAMTRLRTDRRTAAIPVVAVTAFAMEGDRERFIDAGFDGYLTKPIDIRSFPADVASWCRTRSQDR